MRTGHSCIILIGALVFTLHSQESPDPVISEARFGASAFAQTLPDYIVKRSTSRYTGSRPNKRAQPDVNAIRWRTVDVVTGDLAAEHGEEFYSNITVNGKRAKSLPENGAWSAGEFSTVLLEILMPKSAALFTHQTSELAGSRSSYRYDYTIDQAHSSWRLAFHKGTGALFEYAPKYGGAIWIDMVTHQAIRITRSALDMPDNFPVDTFESAIEYDSVKIGDASYILPIHSVDLICVRDMVDCFRNETFFRDYNKFGADTSISFENAGK